MFSPVLGLVARAVGFLTTASSINESIALDKAHSEDTPKTFLGRAKKTFSAVVDKTTHFLPSLVSNGGPVVIAIVKAVGVSVSAIATTAIFVPALTLAAARGLYQTNTMHTQQLKSINQEIATLKRDINTLDDKQDKLKAAKQKQLAALLTQRKRVNRNARASKLSSATIMTGGILTMGTLANPVGLALMGSVGLMGMTIGIGGSFLLFLKSKVDKRQDAQRFKKANKTTQLNQADYKAKEKEMGFPEGSFKQIIQATNRKLRPEPKLNQLSNAQVNHILISADPDAKQTFMSTMKDMKELKASVKAGQTPTAEQKQHYQTLKKELSAQFSALYDDQTMVSSKVIDQKLSELRQKIQSGNLTPRDATKEFQEFYELYVSAMTLKNISRAAARSTLKTASSYKKYKETKILKTKYLNGRSVADEKIRFITQANFSTFKASKAAQAWTPSRIENLQKELSRNGPIDLSPVLSSNSDLDASILLEDIDKIELDTPENTKIMKDYVTLFQITMMLTSHNTAVQKAITGKLGGEGGGTPTQILKSLSRSKTGQIA